ncbi:hypothetical protein ASG63_16355 [Methylobacterium sp. Leaf94]|uniref:phage terminase large subunit family protein n=1 Tax=Methylobacterium sp. Leaf94 TaxID=1736250 RepID=UPI0006F37ABA|nr:phage terminase large subunit family protein [Methylobacterium sp. Leaf94]KQU31070.1 hypothetical protein ASG63_16355 [Methylobacterium sp. Leaf94]
MTETETKIAAAREAVNKAAAVLLEHAEGLGLLAMVESRREPPDIMDSFVVRNGETVFRNLAAEQAWSQAALAAARFAGRFEEFEQARRAPTEAAMAIQDAMQETFGPRPGPPPPLSMMPVPFHAGERHGVTAAEVHHQAWRSYLASSTSTSASPWQKIAGEDVDPIPWTEKFELGDCHFRAERTPYLLDLMKRLGDAPVERVVFRMPSQVGGTALLIEEEFWKATARLKGETP